MKRKKRRSTPAFQMIINCKAVILKDRRKRRHKERKRKEIQESQEE